MNSLYIIDNSNFVYKFKSVYKFAKQEVLGVERDISVLVGYVRALKQNIFKDICIVLDGIPSQSLSVLPSYKGQRIKETNENLGVPKLELVKFLTQIGPLIGKNIQVVCSPGQEADQVIASIVHKITGNVPARWKFLSKLNQKPLSEDRILKYLDGKCITTEFDCEGYDSVIIGTTDSDMAQLQRFDNVCIDLSTSGKQVTNKRTAEAVGNLNPYALVLYKAICGDTSDNVPGIGLPISSAKVAELLSVIKSNSDLSLFLEGVMSGCSTSICQNLQNMILLRKKEFERNLIVVKLDFVSIPFALEFPEYDIRETISKYKLRV